MGVLVAWRMRNKLKTDFLAANGTQSGLSQILCRHQHHRLPDC